MDILTKAFDTFNHKDMEVLIKETYGREFNIPYNIECPNYVCITLDTSPWYGDYEERIKKWVETGEVEYGLFHDIMCDLAERGIIPHGYDYLMYVYW